MPVRVQRKRTRGWRMPENTVSVCRPGKWGNPFPIGGTGWIPVDDSGKWSKEPHEPLTREQTVECFRLSAEWTAAYYAPLAGKNLACWCPLDQPCHADVLLELVNRGTDSSETTTHDSEGQTTHAMGANGRHSSESPHRARGLGARPRGRTDGQ